MRYFFLGICFLLCSCDPASISVGGNVGRGYAPIYSLASNSKAVGVEAIRATKSAGKIYAYSNYVFQVEEYEGIHVIDNTDPQQARKISFISIPGCTELSVKSNFLYANNISDLVVIDISNILQPKFVKRLENAFPAISSDYPPFSGVYFECPDRVKGTVVGWVEKDITNAKCRR